MSEHPSPGAPASRHHEPAAGGRFGDFGGRYVAETLIAPLDDLERAFREARDDPAFWETWDRLLSEAVGRPTPITVCERLTAELGGATLALKREDLCHTGAHKINNTIGQCLLAQRMGKARVIAETGAGQHGVATATACAMLGLSCRVYMGEEDIRRQSLNVFRMQLLGAEVVPVTTGSRTLKDAINEAMRHWAGHFDDTFFCLGSVTGPHPYPWIVREFQSIIGLEARQQCLDRFGRLPSHVMACVGGGSNAIGLFHAFRDDADVALVGVEAAGTGISGGKHAATLIAGRPGVLHGARSYVLQTDDGQIVEAHSISAGLDYPGVGPEHSHLQASGRASYVAVTDDEALVGFRRLAKTEGVIPALETAHAISHAIALAPKLGPEALILVNCSGRGDKDMDTAATALNLRLPLGGER